MEEKKAKSILEDWEVNLISNETLKARSRTLLIVAGVGLALWAAPHVLSAIAQTIRSFKDFKKACKGQ